MPGRKQRNVNSTPANPEIAEGSGEPTGDLIAEISLVRGLIYQIAEQVTGEEAELNERPLRDLLRILEGLSRASSRLAVLLKTQRALDGEQDAGDMVNLITKEAIRIFGNK